MEDNVYPSAKIYVPYAKLRDYILKPNSKHSEEFFKVGYTDKDDYKLFQDIENNFDMEKAVRRVVFSEHVQEFVVYMMLGVTEKKVFRTVWRIDKLADMPRFITAFRDKEGENYV